MIKLYKIKIGDKVYEVELEAVTEKEGKIEIDKKSNEEKTIASASENSNKKREITGGRKVEAPMQGLVLNVLVKEGDNVKAGQDLLILEAMKMENPIVAPVAGTIASVNIAKGDTVESGDTLIILE